jgi:hypothetical protein
MSTYILASGAVGHARVVVTATNSAGSIGANSTQATLVDAVRCDQYASPSGNDSTGTGAIGAPYLTPEKLDQQLAAGQTGCLRSGTYGNTSTQQTFSNATGVHLRSYPGEVATVNGYPLVTGAGTDLAYINFDLNNTSDPARSGMSGCSATGAYPLQIEASNVVIQHDNIYQTDVPSALRGVAVGVGWNNAISNTVIRYNRIHDMGGCNSLDHGIYDEQTTGDQIHGNWIYNDPHGWAIQMYPHPVNAHIYSNVIDNTGAGITVGAESGTPITSNISLDHNVMTNMTGLPVTGVGAVDFSTYWGGTVGTGNTSTSNDSFNNAASCSSDCSGLTVTGTISSDPQFTNRAGNDYRVASTSPVALWGLWNGDLGGQSSQSRRKTTVRLKRRRIRLPACRAGRPQSRSPSRKARAPRPRRRAAAPARRCPARCVTRSCRSHAPRLHVRPAHKRSNTRRCVRTRRHCPRRHR